MRPRWLDELPFAHVDLIEYLNPSVCFLDASLLQTLKCSGSLEFPVDLACRRVIGFGKTGDVGIYVDEVQQLTGLDGLHSDARRCMRVPNAGGHSELSEAFSIDLLATAFGVKECILEMEVQYTMDYKMVDYILAIPTDVLTDRAGQPVRVGVSVTRAFTPRIPGPYSVDTAAALLQKKLSGLIISRETVVEKHQFFQSVLHVWAPDKHTAEMLVRAVTEHRIDLAGLEVLGFLDVWISICKDPRIYKNH
jgi:hypothetical protein